MLTENVFAGLPVKPECVMAGYNFNVEVLKVIQIVQLKSENSVIDLINVHADNLTFF